MASSNEEENFMKQQKLNINGPTWLTLFRIFLAVLFLIFILQPTSEGKIVAFILFVVASLTDAVDGHWARNKKLVTKLGAFLDPLADKMLVNLAFLALVYLGIVPVWAFAIILVRDFVVDGLRMVASETGKTISASPFGKIKTIFQMTTLIVFLLNFLVSSTFLSLLGNVLLYCALALTIVSGVDYLVTNRSVFKQK